MLPANMQHDSVTQTDIQEAIVKEHQRKLEAKVEARRARAAAKGERHIDESRYHLHDFSVKSKRAQLQERANRVAPCQLDAMLHRMVENKQTIIDVFMAWDADGDGSVCYPEFIVAVQKFGLKYSEQVTRELFDFFDKDGNGAISLEEMKKTLN